MKFTVIWRPTALKRLAETWNSGPDRSAISAAANAIDSALKQDPLSQGESRFGNTRILIHDPLAVYFDVSVDDCLVTVWAVWRHS